MSFKIRFRKVLIKFAILFVVFFVFRLGYGYMTNPSQRNLNAMVQNDLLQSESFNQRISNIATVKYKVKKGSNSGAVQTVSVDQKYEKTANVACEANDFEEEEKALRKAIEDENAIIQFQQTIGVKGDRQLKLQIGIQPDKFEVFVEQIKSNYKVYNFNITKKDKTNEYRELNAKIRTLKNIRSSLAELKTKGGKIEEFIQLENRILEVDEQLQGLGVKLGDFDTENEFCTVNISLIEKKQVRSISLYHRVKVALEWTIEYYILMIFLLGGVLFASFISLKVVDHFKILSNFRNDE